MRRGMTRMGALFAALPLLLASGPAADAAVAQPSAPQRAAAAAGGVADPAAFVRGLYDGAGDPDSQDDGLFQTERLRALFRDAEGPAGEIGRLEINYVTGAQDDDVKTANVTTAEVDRAPDRRIVTARFVNIGQRKTIHYFFERQPDGRWYLDDVQNQGGQGPDDHPWTLSLILKYGHDGSDS